MVDGSKWGRVGMASFAALTEMDIIITDNTAPEGHVAGARAVGVNVRIV